MNNTVPAGLIEHAKQRSQAVVKKLRAAMTEIETEIDTNEGVYPYNGGKLSQAELCRRADISQVTLSTPAHRNTTRKMVDEWLTRIRSASITGRKTVRRAVTDRAEEWKRHHKAIAENYRIAELELLDMMRKLKKLENDSAALIELLAKTGVVNVLAPDFSKKED